MKRLHVLLPATATLIAIACPVYAQWAWQWRDEKGQMVYSDVAPPPSIPPSRIIRNPNGQMATAYEAMSAPASGVKVPAKPGQPASGVAAADPDAELRKRLADRAKREQEDAQKAELAQRRQAECERLRNETAYLQGGRRYATPQADGSLSYMDDTQRAAAIQRNQTELSSTCN